MRVCARVVIALIGLVVCWGAIAAQGTVAFAEDGPRFFRATASSTVPVDIPNTPVLRQRVSLDLAGARLDDALNELARQSGLRFMYSKDVVPLDRRVTVHMQGASVAAALTELLLDAGVDVVLSDGGQTMLVRRTNRNDDARQGAGTIAGRIVEAETEAPIVSAQVAVDGRGRAFTDSEGRYRIDGVAPGARTVSVTSIGFADATRVVEVGDGATVTVDFALEIAPTVMNELVVTATGQQRRVELGHVVGRIKADSVVKAAPVSTLGELLNGRVPGLQVHTYQGTVGGEVNLRIRSPNTVQLGSAPIVIVDGVRYTSNPAERVTLSSVNYVEPTSPLNDLNPNEIESIDVVKGPSAATLYGTDAANGVIVVTTKRGQPGPARWNAYVKGATTAIPGQEYPNAYAGWGTVSGTPDSPTCLLTRLATGLCTHQDSITVVPNPFNDPELSIFASKPRWEYGMNVSGGSEDLRYYLAADFEKATGPLRLPSVTADSISQVRELAGEQLEPNAFSKVSVRTNVSLRVGGTAEFVATGGYTDRGTRTLGGGFANPYQSFYDSDSATDPYEATDGPADYFSRTSTEQIGRWFSSLTARWSPKPWLLMRGTAGVDLSNIRRSSLSRGGESTEFSTTGEVSDERGRQTATTAELTATATFSSGRLSGRTSIGAQYVHTLDDVLGTFGTDLPPGASSVGEASSVQAHRNYREQATLGSYLEQQVSLNQRLFLTGALRVDGVSTFGRDYDATVYPKAGLSWRVFDEPLLPNLPLVNELRLRYAFGASGQQPLPQWARPGYELLQRLVGGTVSSVYAVNTLGNPTLRPERVREHEFGFDATVLNSHVDVGVTWFRRRTVDQILNVNLPPGLGTMQTNLGATSGQGFEAQVAAQLLDTRAMSLHVAFQHSSHTTTVVDLGDAPERQSPLGGYVEGYPIGARFMTPLLGYEDANGDGIIATTEVLLGDSATFHGVSAPPRSQTVSTTVGLMDRRLRLSALLERRSGYTQVNRAVANLCRKRCRGLVDPSAPLAEQAQAVAIDQLGYYPVESGDFTRLREVSVSLDVPASITRALHLGTATLSLQGRNLALWTSYNGADPESSLVGTYEGQELGIPQARSWALRFDFGF